MNFSESYKFLLRWILIVKDLGKLIEKFLCIFLISSFCYRDKSIISCNFSLWPLKDLVWNLSRVYLPSILFDAQSTPRHFFSMKSDLKLVAVDFFQFRLMDNRFTLFIRTNYSEILTLMEALSADFQLRNRLAFRGKAGQAVNGSIRQHFYGLKYF